MFEGDHTLVELIDCVENNKDITHVAGIAYKKGHKIIINSRRVLEPDVDSFPFPDYSNIDFSNYSSPGFSSRFIPIMSSRGCPFGCAFCSSSPYWNRQFRARSAENVIREIKTYIKDYKITHFIFYDDNFVINKDRLIEICKGILKLNKKIKFTVASSVRIIDEDRLYWLKKAGCVFVGFGVESGCDKILKNIDKPQNKEEIKKAFNLVRKFNMGVGGSLIVGSPGETKETIKETAELLNEIMPDSLLYGGIMWVLPGTTIYQLAKQKKLLDDTIWLKTNDEIYYTVEHSFKELQKLQILLLYYQAIRRPLKQKLEFIKWFMYLNTPNVIKIVLRKIYYNTSYFIAKYKKR
jgi:radical SAM superfamily enzyme YgiQ (UPF0313 family)